MTQKLGEFINKSIPESGIGGQNIRPLTDAEITLQLKEKTILLEQAEERLKEARGKIENMRVEWRSQQEHLGKLHKDFCKLQQTLGQHSLYCATLGATLGSMLWKISRIDGAVESMLEGTRMFDLVTLMDNSLSAFIEVFGGECIPDPCSNEYQFVLSWCGILTNVTACPDGRFYLTSKDVGRLLLNNLINSLPKFSLPNGEHLKRMILMIIYNLVINVTGLRLMQSHPKLTTCLNSCLAPPHGPDLKLLALRLMSALTQQILDEHYLEHFKDTIRLAALEKISLEKDSKGDPLETAITANRILSNLTMAEKDFKFKALEQISKQKSLGSRIPAIKSNDTTRSK